MADKVNLLKNGKPVNGISLDLPNTKEISKALADEIIHTISTGHRSGRVYKTHIASAPGEPPISDTGALANSVVNSDESVSINAPYAILLEQGTRKMAPRPYIQRSIDAVANEFLKDPT